MPTVNVTGLLAYGKESRKLRAYAYLTASFELTPNTSDVVDCLLPFLTAGVADQAGNVLDINRLSGYLAALGLTVPLYVLLQLIPRLESLGVVEWNKTAHRHICKPQSRTTAPSRPQVTDLSEAFEAFEEQFSVYAQAHGLDRPPLSASWSDALIAFLRSDAASDVIKTTTINDVLIGDVSGVETYLVARFIQIAQTKHSEIFDTIVKIFTGVLIEDFINNIQSVGDATKYNQLSIYYDTTVLLRLLGTSGKTLQTATIEMHRALQDLGCKTLYLEYNLDESLRILNTIVAAHTAGSEIYGETAEALLSNEIRIPTLLDLIATFPDRLGEQNIFQADYHYPSCKSEDIYQIDETALAAGLVQEASNRDRTYSAASAANDARAVAIIMRLRRGGARRNLSGCGHVFVSRNPVLQGVAKRYVARNVEGYEGDAIPPVLTLGQITTVAWLATARALAPQRVTKELLATCYNAVRPSLAWTQQFSKALDKFRAENPGFVESRANAALFLQAARNAARDESLNQPAVLKKANVAALFMAAAEEADVREKERAEEIARLGGEAKAKAEAEQRDAEALQKEQARETEEQLSRIARQAEEQASELTRQFEVTLTRISHR